MIPNAVAVKQTLLEGFVSATARGPRAHVHIGILNVLSMFDQVPFWYTLVHELGFSLVMTHGTPGGVVGAPGMDTIASESVCQPAKQSHPRLYALAQAGATHILFPQYDRVSRCAVNCEYAQLLQENVPLFTEGNVRLVAPLLLARRIGKMWEVESDRTAIYQALRDLVPTAPVSPEEFESAFVAAAALQFEFERAIEQANDEAARWAEQPGHHGIILSGRPYHADPALLHGLDAEITAIGMSVLCGTHVKAPKLPLISDDVVPPWRAAKHQVKLAHYVAKRPHLDLVCLQAFGCGYDTLSMPEARAALREAGKAFTMLQLDDVMNNAQARIRLRTLAYTARVGAPLSTPVFTPAPVAPLADELVDLARQDDPRAFNHLDTDDVTAVFGGYPELCFLAQSFCGRAARLTAAAAEQGRPLERLAVPYVCKYCMLDALPRVVWRTLGMVPEIDWVDYRPATPTNVAPNIPTPAPMAPTDFTDSIRPATADPSSLVASAAAGPANSIEIDPANPIEIAPAGPAASAPALRPVGIVGVAPLVYDPYLNDRLAEFLHNQGCQAVLPDQEYLVDDDMSYPAAFAYFEQIGVRHVIYLNSFCCLKGHIDAHGSLNRMRAEHPDMRISIVDYDSEASVLNRQNRIVLAINAQ